MRQIMTRPDQIVFTPAAAQDDTLLTQEDVAALAGPNSHIWMINALAEMEHTAPNTLLPEVVEYLYTVSLQALYQRVSKMQILDVVGRVLRVDVLPRSRPDPPVPIVELIPLPQRAVDGFNLHLQSVLRGDRVTYPGLAALRLIGRGIDVLTRGEAAAIIHWTNSLETGAWRFVQRKKPTALPPPVAFRPIGDDIDAVIFGGDLDAEWADVDRRLTG